MGKLSIQTETLKLASGASVNVVRVSGGLDYSTYHELDELLDSLRQDPLEVIVDLEGVPYISSSGLAMFVQMCQVYRNSGRDFILTHVQPSVAKVMSMLGMDKQSLLILPTTMDARRYLTSAPFGQRRLSQGETAAAQQLPPTVVVRSPRPAAEPPPAEAEPPREGEAPVLEVEVVAPEAGAEAPPREAVRPEGEAAVPEAAEARVGDEAPVLEVEVVAADAEVAAPRPPMVVIPEIALPEKVVIMMVVPEENRFVRVVRRGLEQSSRQVELVSSCQDALDQFDKLKPDVIILEDQMPGTEAFVRAVKRLPGKSVVPLIRLYSSLTDIQKRRDLKIWEENHLIEPFELQDLFSIAEAELRRFAAEKGYLLHKVRMEFRGSKRREAEQLLDELLRSTGLDEVQLESFYPAVGEAINNGIKHGNKGDATKTINVAIRMEGHLLTVIVEDEGTGFDFEPYVASLRKGEPPPMRLRGGLGISTMFQAVDQLQYESPGNRVRLQVRTGRAQKR